MKLTEIIQEWKKDAEVDDLNVDKASAGVPSLHAKYAEMLVLERGALRGMEITRRSLASRLREYYLGTSTQEDLEILKRDPYPQRILKNEVMIYVEADPELMNLDTKMVIQQEKVDLLLEIMRSIHGRNYSLKNITDWKRMMLGG